MSWTAGDVLAFVEHSVREARGTWVLGAHGAVGEFVRDPDEAVTLSRSHTEVEAATARAALRLRFDDEDRALGTSEDPDPDRSGRIVLAIRRTRLPTPVATALTRLGADRQAIRPVDRASPLFDLGLGRDAVRFCVRTRDPALVERLAAAEGRAWPEYLGDLGATFVAQSPTRVIETGSGRVEIDTSIPPPGGQSSPGPHTHLLPDVLARGVDTPPGVDLPSGYALGAIYYPTIG